MHKILLFLLLAPAMNAQNSLPEKRTCATEPVPQQYEVWVRSLMQPASEKFGNQNQTHSVFNIPVIVHIIHNNETLNSPNATTGGNLNAAQVIDQINILNKDFNGLNADTSLIPTVFKPLLGKFQINFCLAVVNPTGGILAEPGINRINRVAQNWTTPPYSNNYVTNTIKPASIWDPNRYLNIWVCRLSNGLLGFATFPNPGTSGLTGLTGSFGTATTDGVVVLNTSFGSIGTAGTGQFNKGRTATHEIGHWLGLRHVWGDAGCGNDFCNDTPPAQSANYNCPAFPYKLGVCSGNTTGEMTMNYMDYVNDACMYMFTMDQKYRAQLILTHSPMRAALLTSTVCNLPGVTTDISLTFISSPTYSQIVLCSGSISPAVNITNYGTTTVTSALFSYNIVGQPTQTLGWTGLAAPGASVNVPLGQITGLTTGPKIFSVNVSLPNGGPDVNSLNDNNQQYFVVSNSPNFSVSSATICQGDMATLTASGAQNYTWNTGATGASISMNLSVTTVFSVTGESGGCAETRTAQVNVKPGPAITVNNDSICDDEIGLLEASGAESYTWSTSDIGSSIVVYPQGPSVFTVSGTDNDGCIGHAVASLVILECTAISRVGNETDGLKIYPNPAKEEIFVEFSGEQSAELIITDISGRELKHSNISGGITALNLNGFVPGIYFVAITSRQLQQTIKLVVY